MSRPTRDSGSASTVLRIVVLLQAVVLLGWLGVRFFTAEVDPLQLPAGGTAGERQTWGSTRAGGAVTARDAQATAAQATPAVEPTADGSPSADALGLVVHGTIRGADGEPLQEEAGVTIYDLSGAVAARGEQRDRRGYTARGLAPGDYEIRVSAEGHRPVVEPLAWTGDERFVRRDYGLTPTTKVFVQLLDAQGRPVVPDAASLGLDLPVRDVARHLIRITALRELPADRRLRVVRTRYVGEASWRPDLGPPDCYGRIEWHGDLPCQVVLLLRDRIVDSAPLTAGVEIVRLRLPGDLDSQVRHPVTVRVSDQGTGRPIGGAEVQLGWRQSAVTSEAGEASFPTMLDADPRVSVSAEGFAAWEEFVTIDPDSPTTLDVALLPSRRVRVTVLDPEGAPIRARLMAVPSRYLTEVPPPRWTRIHSESTTDADGIAELELANGPVVVRASALQPPRTHLYALVEILPGAKEATLQLAEAAYLPLQTHALEPIDFLLRDRAGNVVTWGRIESITGLEAPLGSYLLETWDRHGRIDRVDLVLDQLLTRGRATVTGR